MGWLDDKYPAMRAVCTIRRAETGGECEKRDCNGVGWCNKCLQAATGRKMTQHERILAYMVEHGGITPMQAFDELGVTKLATRISELKRVGVKFKQRYEKRDNRHGEPVCFMRYWLEE